MGAAYGVRGSSQVAGAAKSGGQPLARPVQAALAALDRPRGAQRHRPCRQAARAGDHRGRVAQQRRARPRHDPQFEEDRPEAGAG